MVQAFLNLVRNAATALAGQGTITLRSRAITNFTIGNTRHSVIASIEIEDDGPGIPAAEREKVFERFYRVPGTTVEGGGLGLAIVREIAERHEARVALLTPESGRGLLVRIEFRPAA